MHVHGHKSFVSAEINMKESFVGICGYSQATSSLLGVPRDQTGHAPGHAPGHGLIGIR
jgi:hypothetical protein